MKSLLYALFFLLFNSHSFGQDCNTINVTTGSQSISASGVAAASIVGMQVFNSSWASVANQSFPSPHGDVVTIGSIPPGNYFVNVRFYSNSWAVICEKGFNVTVNQTPPPPADSCTLTFQKTFGNPNTDEFPIDLTKTPDGGYAAAGLASATGNTNHDALLMKFDSRGNLLWTKTYGGGQVDYFFTLTATSDGGFLAGGSFNSTGYGSYAGEAWLVKTDANGNIQWQRKYTDNINPGLIHSVIQTSDNGYAFTGTFPFNPGVSDVMVIKTDANGNIQWQRKLGVSSSDDGIGIVEDNHGGSTGLVVTGYNYSSTNYDGDIAKFDLSTGNLLWTKTYDLDSRANRFNRITKLSDGFLLQVATHDGFGDDNAVQVLMKTDFNGNVLLAKEIHAPGCKDGHVTALNDGGFLVSQSEAFAQPNSNSDIHLIRTDASGNVLWAKKYPQPGGQWMMRLVTDGNYVVGIGLSNPNTLNDVFMMKTHISGRQSNCTSVDETPTVRTPVVNTLQSPYTVNAPLNLSAVSTASSPVSVNFPTTIMCIDSCGGPPPQVSINSVTVNENAGNAVLQICLSATSTQSVTVQYGTANGSAIAGSDYTATSSTATIPAGQTCTNVSIPILNDAVGESTENFTVSLSNPTNATIGTGTGTVTINDDDQPQINCDAITMSPGNNMITVSGLSAPIVAVQVFNSSWATVFNQSYTNSPGTVNIPIGPGTYHVKATFYTSNWSPICDKNQDITVVNQCPAGTICISNVCPANSVNLNNAYSIPNLPAGTTVSWHTGTPATDANRLTPSQAQNVTTSGTYYAAINISGANCYSNTIPVTVTIIPCNGSSANTSLQVKSTDMSDGSRITAFPNPFTHSVKVIIPSSRNERATIDVVDMMGRSLKAMPVQLVRGTNQVTVDGLEKYPSGSYLIRVKLADRIETLKLLRQQ